MFARFKKAEGDTEINVNTTLVTHFEPGNADGTTMLAFLGGTSVTVQGSNRATRHAVKKANAPVTGSEEQSGD